MSVLLINTPYGEHIFSEYFNPSRPTEEVSTTSLPLGLAYIASVLRESSFEPICLDLEVQPTPLEDIVKIIDKKQVEYVGISSSTPTIKNAIQIANELRKTNAKVILGGPHASAEPLETLSLNCFDVIVVGEGEYTFLEIVEGKKLETVKGIVYSKNGKMKINLPRPPIEDLDAIPFPARDLFPYKRYKPSIHRELNPIEIEPYFTIIASRGCPMGCSFCSTRGVFGKSVRLRSIANITEEIQEMQDELDARKIMFYDDTFTICKNRTEKLCKKIIHENYDLSWGCNTRLDKINTKILSDMKRAGCERIYVGVESGTDLLLENINKQLSINQIKKGVKKIKETGIEISASYIIGVPGETRQTIKQTITLAKEMNTDFGHFYLFTPQPGAAIYYVLKKEGKIRPFDWLDYNTMIKQGTKLLGEQIDWSELIEYVKLAYFEYYSDPDYIQMRLSKLKTTGDIKQFMLLLKEYANINMGIKLNSRVLKIKLAGKEQGLSNSTSLGLPCSNFVRRMHPFSNSNASLGNAFRPFFFDKPEE